MGFNQRKTFRIGSKILALSSYDLLAFDHLGRPCNGVFKNSKGNVAAIRKTYLYLSSEKMWAKSCGFMKPVIAHINEGDVEIAGFEIKAIRGPQSSIFVLLSEWTKKGRRHCGGLGCSGYRDIVSEVLKKLKRAKDINDDWCAGSSSGTNESIKQCIMNFRTREEIVYWDESKDGPYDYDLDWIGVLPSTLKKFFTWLDSFVDEKGDDYKVWLDKCKAAKGLRFNQGDAYFAAALKKDIPVTEVGKKAPPVMHTIIERMKKEIPVVEKHHG